MTEIVYDRDFYTDGTSSVINHVYYSTADKLLFVQLVREDWNGEKVLAGYENVPADVFTALETLNQNRLNGDTGSSVGSYWNVWIKPYFTGYSTADVELLSEAEKAEDEARQAKLRSLLDRPSVFFEDKAPAEEVEEVGEIKFIVHFIEDGDERESGVVIYAGNVDQALVIFNQIAKIAGWGSAKIIAVTQVFN